MNVTTPQKQPPRRWQFRLRSLLIVFTLTAVASAWYGWRCRNYEQLCRCVEEFNTAMDALDYAKAHRIANQAKQLAPYESVVDHMLAKVVMIQSIILKEDPGVGGHSEAKKPPGGFECFGGDDPLGDAGNPALVFNAERWQALTEQRRTIRERRANQ